MENQDCNQDSIFIGAIFDNKKQLKKACQALATRENFEYTSGVPLPTPSGFMTGTYGMVTAAGEQFNIDIPAFSLDTPQRVTEEFVRTVLGSFLFRGDDIFKKVQVLSGGEEPPGAGQAVAGPAQPAVDG